VSPVGIEHPDKAGVSTEGSRRRERSGIVIAPEATSAAEGGQTGRGGETGAEDGDDALGALELGREGFQVGRGEEGGSGGRGHDGFVAGRLMFSVYRLSHDAVGWIYLIFLSQSQQTCTEGEGSRRRRQYEERL
jgi:hypothetical protein